MKENKGYLSGILDAILIITVIFLLILAVPLILGYLDDDVDDIQDVIDSCNNMSLSDASSCTTKVTSGFYKYNLDNIGKEIDFQTLKEEGGVCSSWSDYYNNVGKSLGYNTENVIIYISGNLYHEFNVWSNEERYCILDQTEVYCFEF